MEILEREHVMFAYVIQKAEEPNFNYIEVLVDNQKGEELLDH